MYTVYIAYTHVSVLLYNIIANQFDSKKWIGKKSSKIAKICTCVSRIVFCIVCTEVNRMSGRVIAGG